MSIIKFLDCTPVLSGPLSNHCHASVTPSCGFITPAWSKKRYLSCEETAMEMCSRTVNSWIIITIIITTVYLVDELISIHRTRIVMPYSFILSLLRVLFVNKSAIWLSPKGPWKRTNLNSYFMKIFFNPDWDSSPHYLETTH